MTKTTAVATVNNDLLVYLEKVNTKLNQLSEFESIGFKTHGGFRWNPAYTGNSPINIHTSTDLPELLNIFASLKEKQRAYDAAALENGLTEYEAFRWQDQLGENWLHDLKLRIAAITHNVKKTELMKIKTELSNFMTKEDRLALLMKGIDSIIE